MFGLNRMRVRLLATHSEWGLDSKRLIPRSHLREISQRKDRDSRLIMYALILLYFQAGAQRRERMFVTPIAIGSFTKWQARHLLSVEEDDCIFYVKSNWKLAACRGHAFARVERQVANGARNETRRSRRRLPHCMADLLIGFQLIGN